MIQAQATHAVDRIDWLRLAWRMYLACVATSFFVIVEPAPTDAIFVFALAALLLAKLRPVKIIGPVETIAILTFVWFTLFSLTSDTIILLFTAIRAAAIQIYIVLLFLMTAFFVHIGGDRAFRTILLSLGGGGLICAAIGVLAYLGLIPDSLIGLFYRDTFQTRISSTFKDPNVLGPFLVPTVLFALWVAISVKERRLWATAVFGITLLCLIVTYSRGAWIHMAITGTMFGFCLLLNRRTTMTTFAVGLTGLIAACLIALVFSSAITAFLNDSYLGSRLSLQAYDTSRFDAMYLAIGWIADHPFGIGPNQVDAYYGRYPHNTPLNLAVNNGVFAAAGFILLYLAAMWRCLRMTLRQNDGWLKYAFVLSILAGLAVLINVIPALHWRHMYLVLGLAYGNYRSNALW